MVVVMVAVITTLVGCGSGAPHRASRAAVTFPDTPAARQARWLVGAVPHAPISAAEIAAHFDRAFLVHVSSAAALNASFEQIQRLRVDSITSSTPDTLAFVITVNGTTKLLIDMAVDARGRIDALDRQPAGATLLSPPPGMREIHVGVGSPPLQGTLTLPPGQGQFPAVVLVSGSGANDQNETVGPNHPFLDIAVGLAARGIATLRYDKRTRDYPHSIDPVTITPTEEYVPDALEAIHLLEHQPVVDRHQIFVLGHSQGGTYAPLIARRAPGVAGVILLAGGAEPLGAALERQVRYLATLPGTTGAQASAQLLQIERIASEINNVTALQKVDPRTTLLGGAGPRYFLSVLRYDEVRTARTIRQPLLLLQGDRDYQVTVRDDLDVWLKGLHGRNGVTVVQFPNADHLFLDGTGRPTPIEYAKPGNVDPTVITTIASWISKVRTTSS